jgi:amino acid transporter
MASSPKKDYGNEVQSLSDETHSNGPVDAYSAPLHRKLKSRHLQMIAIGGIIGPGLLVGSGNALKLAGPAGILISFSLVGIIVYFVM